MASSFITGASACEGGADEDDEDAPAAPEENAVPIVHVYVVRLKSF